jgi:hypothetical protein
LLLAATAGAEWRFDAPLLVGEPPRAGLFHQLDGAGRKHVAASDTHVAVTWSDNADGAYQARVAFRALDGEGGFGPALALSSGAEAYQPVVAVLGDGRFLFAWEQDERVWLRSGSAKGLGPARRLDTAESTQPALVADAERGAMVAWVRREDGVLRLQVAALRLAADGALEPGPALPVDREPARRDQLYPSLALTPAGLVVAWEDRRDGHTRLFTAFRPQGGAFSAPRGLNEQPEGERSVEFGAGYGVTRVALASRGERVVAVWMDKRDYRSGYDVFAALSEDGGRLFDINERVPDMFGDNIPQWRPAVAISPAGRMVTVWDDTRDDSPDLWLSWREDDGWSENQAVPAAYGPGAHTAPALAFDPHGGLHLLWTSRTPEGISQLRYVSTRQGS